MYKDKWKGEAKVPDGSSREEILETGEIRKPESTSPSLSMAKLCYYVNLLR